MRGFEHFECPNCLGAGCEYCLGGLADPKGPVEAHRYPVAPETCGRCDGDGYIIRLHRGKIICTQCNGTGEQQMKDSECEECAGSGQSRFGDMCSYCNGTGKQQEY